MKDRHLYIGASDIPSIMGLGPMTPLEKFLEKRRELHVEQTSEMMMGKHLEPFIIDRYLDSHPE